MDKERVLSFIKSTNIKPTCVYVSGGKLQLCFGDKEITLESRDSHEDMKKLHGILSELDKYVNYFNIYIGLASQDNSIVIGGKEIVL